MNALQVGLGSLSLSLVLMLPCGPAVAQQPASAEVTFDIDSQPIGDAINAFAAQTGLQVVLRVESIPHGLTAPKVAGSLTPAAALRQLLKGTGLEYEYLDERTIAIVAPKSKAQASAAPVSPAREALGGGTGSALRLARSTDDQSNTAGGRQEKDSDRQMVQEIVVTAQKRSERLQDVPLSISVLTADDISRRGLVHSSDYLRGVAGVSQMEQGYGGQAIIIRGMETRTLTQNFYSGATTGTYFGETSTTNSAGLLGANVDIKLVDIERVEVLRGPQGTAFGSSALGGAVRQIPVAPKVDRFEAKLGAGYSQTSDTGGRNHMFQGVANIPLIQDKFAIRAVAYSFSDSGYVRNRAGSDTVFQARIIGGAQGFATDEEEMGAYAVEGARVAALFRASDKLKFTLSYLTQKGETDGHPLENDGPYTQELLRVAPEHVRRGQASGFYDNQIDIANAVVEYDLGWADLLATYSHIKGDLTSAIPYTFFQQPWPASALVTPTHRENSGEVRLATKLTGAWNFLAGLYAEDFDDAYPSQWIWYGDPAANFFSPGARALGSYLDRRSLTQKAAFGEVSWQFMPGWTLTGGARAYRYDRTAGVDSSGPLFGATTSTRNSSDESGATYRANLSYKPVDNALLYAGWSQGFRLGRPQAPVLAAFCDTDSDGLVDGTSIPIASTGMLNSDSVDNYELGGKFATAGRRVTVDATVFRMDWSDIPALVGAACGNTSFGTTWNANVGAARSEGIEFQAGFQATRSLRVDVSASHVNARLVKDAPREGLSAGMRLPGAPKVNAGLGVQQEFAIGGHAAFVRADAIYVGPFYSRVGQSTVNGESGDYVKLDASARISIDKLNVDLYVRNLTNEDAFTGRGNDYGPLYGYRLRPRTIGLQLGYDF